MITVPPMNSSSRRVILSSDGLVQEHHGELISREWAKPRFEMLDGRPAP